NPWILLAFFVGIFALSTVSSIFYEVGPDEVGVVQRFGKYLRTTNPGLHTKLPLGLETVRNIRVTHVFKEEFGFRTVDAGVRTVFSGRANYDSGNRSRGTGGDPFLEESLMLTGD